MTRDEIVAVLVAERYAPRPTKPAAQPPEMRDDEVTCARRRRELLAAVEGWHEGIQTG